MSAAIMNHVPDGETGIISPNHWLGPRHEIVCANSLSSPQNQLIPVLLMNPNPNAVTIHKNTTLGYFQPCHGAVHAITIGNLNDELSVQPVSTPRPTAPPVAYPDPPAVDLSQADLNDTQKASLWQLLLEYRSIFANHISELGLANVPPHVIDVGDARPVHRYPYRVSRARQEIIAKEIQTLLDNDIIEPSNSPWSSPILIVFKKSGEPRPVIDFRAVNAVTRPDPYPMPILSDMFFSFGEAHATIFSTLDLKSGFHQIGVAEGNRQYTQFTS